MFSFTPLTVLSPACTWSSSYCGTNAQFGIGSPLFGAFSAISEANANKQASIDMCMRTGNHFGLPNGSYLSNQSFNNSGMKIVKGNGYVRYENEQTGQFSVIGTDGRVSYGSR